MDVPSRTRDLLLECYRLAWVDPASYLDPQSSSSHVNRESRSIDSWSILCARMDGYDSGWTRIEYIYGES